MYFFKYIFGFFYVVIIVAVCIRINTNAAVPPNTEVKVYWYEKEPIAALSSCVTCIFGGADAFLIFWQYKMEGLRNRKGELYVKSYANHVKYN